jgi:hypothetical protein
MGKSFRRKSQLFASFLSICFLVALVFSVYYEMSEVDAFSSNLCYEEQDLGTLTTVEKVKVNLSFSYFEHPLLPICNSFLHPREGRFFEISISPRGVINVDTVGLNLKGLKEARVLVEITNSKVSPYTSGL